MSCPDLWGVRDDRPRTEEDPGVREHLQTCLDCRRDMLLIQAAKAAFAPQPETSPRLDHLNELVLRTMAERRIQRAIVRPVDVGVTGLLGALTVVTAILTTGGHLQPGATTLELALVAAGGGVAAAAAHILAGRREHTLALQAARI